MCFADVSMREPTSMREPKYACNNYLTQDVQSKIIEYSKRS